MVLAAVIGFAFGFIGSMPIAGPIAALVFYRGLEDRTRGAIALAFGASIAEAVYAGLAFWGFAELITEYHWIDPLSRGAAAVILLFVGFHFTFRLRSRPKRASSNPRVGQKRSFLLGFTITALNPALIATWTGAVTAVHSFGFVQVDASAALPFALSACLGLTTWFAVLLALLAKYKDRFRRDTLEAAIRVTGVGLIGLGLYFGYRFVVTVVT